MRTAAFFSMVLLGSLLSAGCKTLPTAVPAPGSGPAAVASLTLRPDSALLTENATLQLDAVVKDSAGNVLAGRNVTWLSNATQVATVTVGGVVGAVAAGTARITASSEGRSASAVIVVIPAPVSSVDLAPASARVWIGQSLQLSVIVRDAFGNVLTGRSVTWSSSNGGVAAVSATGLVRGKDRGTATIRASVEGKSATASVAVTWNVTGHWNGWSDGCTWLPQGNGCFTAGSWSLDLTEAADGSVSGTAIQTDGVRRIGLTVSGENTPIWLRLAFTGAADPGSRFEGIWDGNGVLRLCGLLFVPDLNAYFAVCLAKV